MATPRELWAADRARKAAAGAARGAKVVRARGPANDNAPREPDGYLTVDGVAMPYWLPPTAQLERAETA